MNTLQETLKDNEYQCAHCLKIYEKEWTDEEAMEESVREWGEIPKEELAIVCDDCYKGFYSWAAENGLTKDY